MTTMRARLERLVAWVLLPAVLAAAAAPKPEDREIPPDRGRLFLLDKEYRRVLGRLGDPATPLDKRVEIVGVFALTRETRAVPDLVKIVRNTREPFALKTAALWALGEIGDPRGIVALQHALNRIYTGDPAWARAKDIALEADDGKRTISLREMCEARLGRLAEPVVGKFAELLHRPLQETSEPTVDAQSEQTGRMRAALISLAAVGDRDPRAVSTLTDVLRADDKYYPWDFKVIAAEALTTLAVRRVEEFKGVEAKDTMIDRIAGAFVEASVITAIPEVRELAGVTLRKIGWRDKAARRLVAVLRTPNLPKQPLYHAIEALAFIQSKAAADQLIFHLFDPDRNVRWRAAVALGATGDPRAVGFLRKLTTDKDAVVRAKACAALGHLQNPLALPNLTVAMDDPDYRVRRQAALALGRVGREAALPVLIKTGLKDPAGAVRAMAVIAIGYIGRSAGLKHVPPMLDDPEAAVRLVAVQVLARFLNPGATKAMAAALGDADKNVREAAVAGMAQRLAGNPKEALGFLADAIEKTQGEGRAAAIACLDQDFRKVRSTRDAKRLALYDELLKDASRPLAKALIAALADPNPATRAAAGKLLADYAWPHKQRDLLKRVAALATDPDRKARNVGYLARNYLNNLR